MKQLPFYLITFMVLLLAMLPACASIPLSQPAAAEPALAEVVIPSGEDQPVPQKIEAIRDLAGDAANPELMKARRYIPQQSEVDPEGDIGLLEHFSAPAETGEQQVIQTDADKDIGLLEFFHSIP